MKNGYHLLLDAVDCKFPFLGESAAVEFIHAFLLKIVKTASMQVIDGPHCKYHIDINDSSENGPTGIVVLAESHSSIHCYLERGYLAFDLFSCKSFNPDSIVTLCKETFSLNSKNMKVQFIDRGIKILARDLV